MRKYINTWHCFKRNIESFLPSIKPPIRCLKISITSKFLCKIQCFFFENGSRYRTCFDVGHSRATYSMLYPCPHKMILAFWVFSQTFCFSRLPNKFLLFLLTIQTVSVWRCHIFFAIHAHDSPLSSSCNILYFSLIVLVFNFLLQPAAFDILISRK